MTMTAKAALKAMRSTPGYEAGMAAARADLAAGRDYTQERPSRDFNLGYRTAWDEGCRRLKQGLPIPGVEMDETAVAAARQALRDRDAAPAVALAFVPDGVPGVGRAFAPDPEGEDRGHFEDRCLERERTTQALLRAVDAAEAWILDLQDYAPPGRAAEEGLVLRTLRTARARARRATPPED